MHLSVFADVQHISFILYGTMQPEYTSAECLSVVKCASNRRLIAGLGLDAMVCG